MIVAPPPGGVNGACAPTPQIPPAAAGPPRPDIHPAAVERMTAGEIRAHLDRHADGSVPLTRGQVVCLESFLRERETAARMASLQPRPVHVPPAAKPVKTTTPSKTPKARPAAPAKTAASQDRVTAADKVKGLTRLYARQLTAETPLSPVALATYAYLLLYSTDGRVTATGKQIGRHISRTPQTVSPAIAELEAAGLLYCPHHGTPGGTVEQARSVYLISLPPETTDTDPTV